MHRTLPLLLLLVACGATARGEPAPSSRATLITIHMVTPQIGWGLTQHRLVRTNDGGRVWRTVPVSLPRVPNMLNVNVALAVHGTERVWLVPPIQDSRGVSRSVVLSTVDGGRTWYRSNPIRGIGGSISWITARTGYILTHDGAAAGSVPNDLYRTQDGGRHWTLREYNHLSTRSPASLPGCDGLSGISFRTTGSGWATGACGPAPQLLLLYNTSDGGRRWRQQRLSPPPGVRAAAWNLRAPAFFGRTGVLPVIVGPPVSFDLYVTHHAGTTWSPTTPIRAGNPMAVPDAFALSPSLAWSWLDNTLYVTENGGGTWRRLAPLSFTSQPELDFLTPRIGFALGTRNGAHTFTWILRKTMDGGHTWQTLHPVLE